MPNRRSSLNLFTVAGVQIAIDFSWLFIFALIWWSLSAGYFPQTYPGYSWTNYWIVGLFGTLLFFASVVIHELCHAAMANRHSQQVSRITLFIFGGMAHLSGEPKEAAEEFKIAAVGPLSSLALGALFWLIPKAVGLGPQFPLWNAVLRYLAFINVALAVFNLLPGFPLDGGRLLRAALWWRWGDLRRATARASDWGRGIAFGLIALGTLEIFTGSLVGGLWLIFIALFLRSAAVAGYQNMIVDQMLSDAKIKDIMVREPVTLDPDATVADAIEGYFLRHGFGGFPVVSDGEVAGLLSLQQVRHCPAAERGQRRVREIMRPIDEKVEIPASATVAQALQRMAEVDAGRLLVMEDGKLVGLITRSGIGRFVHLRSQLEAPLPGLGPAQ